MGERKKNLSTPDKEKIQKRGGDLALLPSRKAALGSLGHNPDATFLLQQLFSCWALLYFLFLLLIRKQLQQRIKDISLLWPSLLLFPSLFLESISRILQEKISDQLISLKLIITMGLQLLRLDSFLK